MFHRQSNAPCACITKPNAASAGGGRRGVAVGGCCGDDDDGGGNENGDEGGVAAMAVAVAVRWRHGDSGVASGGA
ncbi:hypothetical protein Tco_0771302 [Tanacetum coccineum]|uniref:Uncharacterized protein n=1 Tax=Tanacetum coccineum TaxID=301880 RepID=A0ABQ4ZH90_9ASTR